VNALGVEYTLKHPESHAVCLEAFRTILVWKKVDIPDDLSEEFDYDQAQGTWFCKRVLTDKTTSAESLEALIDRICAKPTPLEGSNFIERIVIPENSK